ncbi:unnamed protein product, partial [Symbiodinium microadriaticum]
AREAGSLEVLPSLGDLQGSGNVTDLSPSKGLGGPLHGCCMPFQAQNLHDDTMLERRNSLYCLLCLSDVWFRHAPLVMVCRMLSRAACKTSQDEELFFEMSASAVSFLLDLLVRRPGFRRWLSEQQEASQTRT